MNKVILTGHIVKDIEIKDKLGKFTLAVKRPYKNSEGNYDSDFLNCILFNATDYIKQNLIKGTHISLEGRIQTRTYEIEGNKRYVTEILTERVEILKKVENEPNKAETNPYKDMGAKVDYEFKQQEINLSDDEYPF